MTLALMIAATVILLVLILWRGRSREFRRRSEYPKFRFLSNLGIRPRRPGGPEVSSDPTLSHDPNPTPKEQHEDDEP
jgi:hypothetical protein